MPGYNGAGVPPPEFFAPPEDFADEVIDETTQEFVFLEAPYEEPEFSFDDFDFEEVKGAGRPVRREEYESQSIEEDPSCTAEEHA